jgi:hypothetical protein
MDLLTMIGELRAEKQRLDEAIAAVERLSKNRSRQGRPPNWLNGQIGRTVEELSQKPLRKSVAPGADGTAAL